MKSTKLLLVLAIGMLMTSCTTTVQSTLYRYDENTARYITPAMQPTYITPTIADLDISSTKVVESETYENTLTNNDITNIEHSPTIEYWKNLTVSKVVQKYNADVIVAPIFDVKTSDDFLTVTVTVTGYPATFKNFRKVTNDDAPAMRIYGIEIATPEIILPTK